MSIRIATRLVDCCELITKGTTPTTLGLPFESRGVPFLRAQNLVDGSVSIEADPLFISSDTHRALSRSQIKSGDVLISIAGTIGRASVVPESVTSANCNQAVAIVRLGKKLDRRFILHWLSSENAVNQISKGKVTGTISNLSLTEIGNLSIPLPPLDEQRRIAAILDKADVLRRKRKRALDLGMSLTRSIFEEMFEIDSASFSSKNTIEELAEFVTDGEHQTPRRSSSGIKLLSARNVQMGYIDTRDVDYIDESEYSRISKRLKPQPTDVLISCSGTIGRVSVLKLEEPIALVRSVALVRPLAKLHPVYLEHFLRTPKMQSVMRLAANSSGQPNLFQNQIKRLQIFVPSFAEQNKFAKRIESVSLAFEVITSNQRLLDDLFASLQHRAFSGQL